MINFKIYRWACCALGARSFKMKDRKVYAIVKGDPNNMVYTLLGQGWIEEWPKYNKGRS